MVNVFRYTFFVAEPCKGFFSHNSLWRCRVSKIKSHVKKMLSTVSLINGKPAVYLIPSAFPLAFFAEAELRYPAPKGPFSLHWRWQGNATAYQTPCSFSCEPFAAEKLRYSQGDSNSEHSKNLGGSLMTARFSTVMVPSNSALCVHHNFLCLYPSMQEVITVQIRCIGMWMTAA